MHRYARRWLSSVSDCGSLRAKRAAKQRRPTRDPRIYAAVFEGSSRILSALLRSQPPR
jgi:hypothetical protein